MPDGIFDPLIPRLPGRRRPRRAAVQPQFEYDWKIFLTLSWMGAPLAIAENMKSISARAGDSRVDGDIHHISKR